MERKSIEKLTHVDQLPDQFIYYASRDDSFFQNRSIKMFDVSEGVKSLLDEIPIPNDLILCDSCNSRIETKKIALLIQITDDPYVSNVRQAVCKNCDSKYFSDFIHIGTPDPDPTPSATTEEEVNQDGV